MRVNMSMAVVCMTIDAENDTGNGGVGKQTHIKPSNQNYLERQENQKSNQPIKLV